MIIALCRDVMVPITMAVTSTVAPMHTTSDIFCMGSDGSTHWAPTGSYVEVRETKKGK